MVRILGGQVYVSFSGGKDSTVLLHLVRSLYPEVPALFVDTGLEYPELKAFVKSIENVTTVRPDITFRNVIEKYGYPIIGKQQARAIRDLQNPTDKNLATRNLVLTGYTQNGTYAPSRKLANKWVYLKDAPFKISEQCCDVMKKKPSYKYEKQTGRKSFVGTMTCESSLREKEWLMHGCNSFDTKIQKSKPISFWTEQDILKYLVLNDLSYASVYGDIIGKSNNSDHIFNAEEIKILLKYGTLNDIKLETTGESRTGCVFCCFGVHLESEPNRFQRMKTTHPKLYEYCIKDWDLGGLGIGKVLDHINVNY